MSHLSILPTVLRDADLLAASLVSLGLQPRTGGRLRGFAAERQEVVLRVSLADGLDIGWCRVADGSLALVADLQRLSRRRDPEALLAAITRAYAAREALRQAATLLPDALIEVGA